MGSISLRIVRLGLILYTEREILAEPVQLKQKLQASFSQWQDEFNIVRGF